MALHTFKRVQIIPASIGEVWSFFSNPANLNLITPPSMKMETISQFDGGPIYAGQLIEYRLQVLVFPVFWITEITQVDSPHFFIDEQRNGPYKLWRHKHYFKETAGGVEMTDIVNYRVPYWIFGDLANLLFVRWQLKSIFDYRYRRVKELFK